ncbi:MAG TPA: zf-HC2 domain-containing protein [Actinomycetota bacterium]|nr:zf-HC2 domain-containing protein [Actinomycetota bacterium]
MIDMQKLGMPSCESVSQLVSESHDRPISWSERAKIGFHVAMCRYCTRFQRQLGILKSAIERDKRGDASGD